MWLIENGSRQTTTKHKNNVIIFCWAQLFKSNKLLCLVGSHDLTYSDPVVERDKCFATVRNSFLPTKLFSFFGGGGEDLFTFTPHELLDFFFIFQQTPHFLWTYIYCDHTAGRQDCWFWCSNDRREKWCIAFKFASNNVWR